MKTPSILLLTTLFLFAGCASRNTYIHEEWTETGASEFRIKNVRTKKGDILTEGTATDVPISKLIGIIEKRSNLKIILSDDISSDTHISFVEVDRKTWTEFLERILPQNGMEMIFVSEDVIQIKKSEELSANQAPQTTSASARV